MPEILPPTQKANLLQVVVEHGYTRREEPFRLASGELSHDYVDMRRAVSAGANLALVAESVVQAIAAVGDYEAIGGMTMGADPVSHAIAVLTGKGWYSVRKAEKDHGAGRRIEGTPLHEGTPVVVFEDTVSTGQSLVDALEVVLQSGATVLACVTVLDRGELAAPLFAARAMPYLALLSYRDLGIEPVRGAPASSSLTGS